MPFFVGPLLCRDSNSLECCTQNRNESNYLKLALIMCGIATETKLLSIGNVNEKRRIVQGSGSIVRLEYTPLDISPANSPFFKG